MAEKNVWAWAGNFAQGFVGQRPIFARGVEIGYWREADGLCAGQVMLRPQYAKVPQSEWTTKDDFWRDVPVAQYCASIGLRPVWMNDEEFATAKAAAPVGAGVIQGPVQAITQAPAAIAEMAKDFGTGAKWAAIGGLTLVALVLILKSDGRAYYR